MMKEVKYICKHCGKAEEYTKKEMLTKTIVRLTLMVLCVLGLLFIIYFFIVGPDSLLTTMLFLDFNPKNQAEYHQMRLLTMDITKECNGDSSLCYAKELYKNVSGIRYVPTLQTHKSYSPMEVYAFGGDCKNTANMYSAMLMSVGIKAKMYCNVEHCVSVIPNYWFSQRQPGYLVVDLTGPSAWMMNDTDPIWDYESLGETAGWDFE
jgi:hypothetical protein